MVILTGFGVKDIFFSLFKSLTNNRTVANYYSTMKMLPTIGHNTK